MLRDKFSAYYIAQIPQPICWEQGKAEEKAKEAAKGHDIRFWQNGVDFETVEKSITRLTEEEPEELRESS